MSNYADVDVEVESEYTTKYSIEDIRTMRKRPIQVGSILGTQSSYNSTVIVQLSVSSVRGPEGYNR
jgi:hypothetical protein